MVLPPEALYEKMTGFEPMEIRFRIVHVLYFITVLASAIATFGAVGIPVAVAVSFFWIIVLTSHDRFGAFMCGLIFAATAGVLIAPTFRPGIDSAARVACRRNMKMIGLALHDYHDAHGSYPPEYLADEDGKPMHSWRVLLLPFMEARDLYDRYDFDEPWDGPSNIKLLDQMPWYFGYGCPHDSRYAPGRTGYTSYVAVVGPTTAWPDEGARTREDFQDDPARTAWVIEDHSQSIPWLEPRDLKLDKALETLASRESLGAIRHPPREDFTFEYSMGRGILMADGSWRDGRRAADRTAWSALLGIDDGVAPAGGEPFLSGVHKRLRIDNFVCAAFLAVVVLFPLPWVWRKRQQLSSVVPS